MSVRVLVTGASGFIGGAIADAASRSGWAVRRAGRRPAPGRDACTIDLRIPESLLRACEGVEVVVHAAGLAHVFGTRLGPAEFDAVNVQGTAAVAQAAVRAGVRRLVLLSSVSVYGDGPAQPAGVDEAAACRPATPYGRSKLAGETAARAATAAAGLELVVLRLATVYGPGDPGNVARLIRTLDQGRFVWIGAGDNRKTLVHIDDVARAVMAAAALAAPAGVYNLAARPARMVEIVAHMAQALGRPMPALRVPESPVLAVTRLLGRCSGRAAALAASLSRWVADDVYDGRRFERTFGWAAAVPLADGLRTEVEWYRTNRAEAA